MYRYPIEESEPNMKMQRFPRRWFVGFCLGLLLTVGLGSWQVVRSQDSPDAETFALTPIDLSLNPETDSSGKVPQGLSISPSPVPDGERAVIGEDDRVLMTSGAYPWSAIGRVEQYDIRGQLEGWCTGTLIGRNTVLTNAHCVIDANTHQLTDREMVFRPNVIRGRSSDTAKAIAVEYGTNFNDGRVADDWALIQLDEPLGEYYGEIGWLVPAIERPEVLEILQNKLNLVGYSFDFPDNAPGYAPGNTPGIHRNCSILGLASDDRLLHDCDTNSGASGATLLGRLASGKYVILGLHAGAAETNTGDIINYGMQVDRWQNTAREMMR
ncbi:trypsin-like serine peptidase [Baaleninema sp.]|uniref:trypsin-like serine peptidase n=1 Tax=Baaleninema sp. TaxID=3101197 RepID=UPI003D09457F